MMVDGQLNPVHEIKLKNDIKNNQSTNKNIYHVLK